MNDRVKVTSMTKGQIVISVPELRFKREWPKKNTTLPIEKDILREIIFIPGVEYMFKNGILYIDDLDFKIEIGLEPENAKEPVNIIALNDVQMKRILTVLPVSELKKELEKLSANQKRDLATYAIENECVDMAKIDILNASLNIDLLRAVQLKRQNQED